MATVFLQASNNALSILAATLAAGATAVNIDDITNMPGSFPFRLTIWDAATYGYTNAADDPNMEIVEVTGWSGAYYYPYTPAQTEYTILRAREGTADVEHASGQTIALLITAGMIQQIQDAITALEGP